MYVGILCFFFLFATETMKQNSFPAYSQYLTFRFEYQNSRERLLANYEPGRVEGIEKKRKKKN